MALHSPVRWLLFFAAGLDIAELSTSCVEPIPSVNVTSDGINPGDSAIWVNPRYPSDSYILGTDEGTEAVEYIDGALNVYWPNLQLVRSIGPLNRPSNVDVEYGLQLPDGRFTDIVVTCEQGRAMLRIYEIPSLRSLDGGGLPVFEGQADRRCTGVALYQRPRDGAVFAILSRKSGPSGAYLWQYRLQATSASTDSGAPLVVLSLVRQFGEWSGQGEIGSVAVDDAAGAIFYSDEACCVRKYPADAAEGDIAVSFGRTGLSGHHEGIAVYANNSLPLASQPEQYQGFIFVSEQHSTADVQVYCRAPPHAHVASFALDGVNASDGFDVTGLSLGQGLSEGGMVVPSEAGHGFATYSLENIVHCIPTDACKAPPHQERVISQILSIAAMSLMLLCSLGYVVYLLVTRVCGKQHNYGEEALKGDDLEDDDYGDAGRVDN